MENYDQSCERDCCDKKIQIGSVVIFNLRKLTGKLNIVGSVTLLLSLLLLKRKQWWLN